MKKCILVIICYQLITKACKEGLSLSLTVPAFLHMKEASKAMSLHTTDLFPITNISTIKKTGEYCMHWEALYTCLHSTTCLPLCNEGWHSYANE